MTILTDDRIVQGKISIRLFKSCTSFLTILATGMRERRKMHAYQSLDPRFAKDIGMSPRSLEWECDRAPWHEITFLKP